MRTPSRDLLGPMNMPICLSDFHQMPTIIFYGQSKEKATNSLYTDFSNNIQKSMHTIMSSLKLIVVLK